jgi:hypothetical protein
MQCIVNQIVLPNNFLFYLIVVQKLYCEPKIVLNICVVFKPKVVTIVAYNLMLD